MFRKTISVNRIYFYAFDEHSAPYKIPNFFPQQIMFSVFYAIIFDKPLCVC